MNKNKFGLILVMILILLGVMFSTYEVLSYDTINTAFLMPAIVICFYLFLKKTKDEKN